MVLCELLEKLRNEGLPATGYRVHYGITAGHVSRPKLDGAGRYIFTDSDVTAIRAYLQNIPRPGRRKETLEPAGPIVRVRTPSNR